MLAGDARLDPDRVYVMGPSMGGLGSYMLAARRPPSIEAASLTIAARLPRHPESFAAVVPMCGGVCFVMFGHLGVAGASARCCPYRWDPTATLNGAANRRFHAE